MTDNKYDEMQYESYPFFQSHPQHLYTIAKLFGIDAPDFNHAKILELGCASGGNLMPMACQFPNSEFVGIDLAETQIKEGLEDIKNLDLKNITLKHKSILDITKEDGKFDYIICHGVFSWVPADVRDKIMAICQENLVDTGVAYISYNTLPGWNMIRSIRDMMLFHVKNIQDPKEKAKQARGLLQFITTGLQNDDSAYAKMLKNEMNMLSRQGDYYLCHDHLEEVNEPVYFHEFVEQAGTKDLAYLSDCHVSTMFPHNLPEAFSKELANIKDILRTEQYMDFITNRRFRSSLFVHKDVVINRKLEADTIRQFYITSNFAPKETTDEMILSESYEVTFSNAQMTFKSKDPVAKAALWELAAKAGKPITFDELCLLTAKKTGLDSKTMPELLQQRANLMRLYLAGLISFHSTPYDYVTEVNEKPMASNLVRYQVEHGKKIVTNQRHQSVPLNEPEQLLLKSLDGEHDLQQLQSEIMTTIESGAFQIKKEGEEIKDKATLEQVSQEFCKNTLTKFAQNALLTSDHSQTH